MHYCFCTTQRGAKFQNQLRKLTRNLFAIYLFIYLSNNKNKFYQCLLKGILK
jgi:hypothetical protein